MITTGQECRPTLRLLICWIMTLAASWQGSWATTYGPFSQRACGEHLHLFGGRENIVAQYGVVMLPTYILSIGFADSPRFSRLWRMVGPISGDFLVGKWIVRNSF